ncbi:MAG TPA: hypothetical protein VLR90_23770 [Blastocatellia bacterium]|nr:hypothetical protein [Blastocatellia bacterium]
MKIKQLFASFTLSLIVFSSVVAQSPPQQDSTKPEQERKVQEELEKKALVLLDGIIKEAQSLKLPENRIYIQASAADLLWPHDEKRARALFKEVINSFVEIVRKADYKPQRPTDLSLAYAIRSYNNSPDPEMLAWMRIQLRQELLQLLMRHDAKWGREFLRASRQSANTIAVNTEVMNFEFMIDMQFASHLAESEPKQALEIAQEGFDKAFSMGQQESLFTILQQLQLKDTEAAAKMAGDLMKKFRSENLASNVFMFSAALRFLDVVTQQHKEDSTQEQTPSKNERPLLDEQSLRDLAEMLASAALTKTKDSLDDDMGLEMMQLLIPHVEKYAPSRVAALRAKIKEFTKPLNPQEQALSELSSKGEDATAEDFLRMAAKMPAEEQGAFYGRAARRAIEKGDLERARQIVNEHIADTEQRKNYLEEIDRHTLMNAVREGKLEAARQALAQIESPEERAIILSQLAASAAAKGDKKIALQLIDEVRSLVGNQPENATQFIAQVQLAGTAASIDAVQSFEILEGMIDQLNAIVAASAVLDGFENRQQFREGEMTLRGQGVINGLFQYWSNDLQLLARTDFDRAREATERFQRSEMRLMVRLSITGGVLLDKIRVTENQRRRSLTEVLMR